MTRRKLENEKRNPKGQGRKCQNRLPTCRVTDEEYEKFCKLVKEAGISAAGFIRKQVFEVDSKIKPLRKLPVDAESLWRNLLVFSAILTQLSKMGGNVYQIVRKLNFGEPVLLARIHDVLTEIRDNLEKIKHEIEDLSRKTRTALTKHKF